MKAEFIGESKHYKKGKVYSIASKLSKAIGTPSIQNVITVYNIDDDAALYKFNKTDIIYTRGNNDTDALESCPYRTYTTIEDFVKDWKILYEE